MSNYGRKFHYKLSVKDGLAATSAPWRFDKTGKKMKGAFCYLLFVIKCQVIFILSCSR